MGTHSFRPLKVSAGVRLVRQRQGYHALVSLAASLAIFGCDASSHSVGPKSPVSVAKTWIAGGFSLTLVTDVYGAELSLKVNSELTMLTICSIPPDFTQAQLFKLNETLTDIHFSAYPTHGSTLIDGGCISYAAPFTAYIRGPDKGLSTQTFATFPTGPYLFALSRPAPVGFESVDQVTFVLPDAPPASLSDLADEVDQLLESGALTTGHANALHATLNAATRQRDAGNNAACAGILRAFINQVQALERAEKLSATQAQELVTAAQALIDDLSG